jgi:hypothetical protein
MSSPTYWSQPNQQVVRDGDPVGIIENGPDPQTEAKAKAKSSGKAEHEQPEPDDKGKGKSST